MGYIIFSTLIIIALAQFFLLKTSLFFTILAVGVSLAGVAAGIFQKHLEKKIRILVNVFGIILSCSFLILSAGNGNGQTSYEKRLERAENELEKGELDKGLEILSKLEETYGADDNTIYLKTLELLAKQDYEGAYAQLEQMADKKSTLYYAVKEQIYTMDPSEESFTGICNMYIEAASEWPEWTYMQKRAGMAQLELKNYRSAAYFLERALLQDREDGEIYYYLGAANYYLSNYETCYKCFDEALEYGVSKELEDYILWYVNQIEEE